MHYSAITVDTQVLESNGFDFNGGLLAQLKQFRDSDVQFVMSDLVVQEATRHIKDRIIQARDGLEKNSRKAILFGLIAKDDVPSLKAVDPIEAARRLFAKFIDDIGATVISMDGASSGRLMVMYEQAHPPFSGTGKKKSEFPDAIALLTLAQWAETNGKKLLAVSGDPDWLNFKDDNVTVVCDLDTALPLLQSEADRAALVFRKALALLRDEAHPLRVRFDSLLAEATAEHDVEVDVDSSRLAESEGADVKLESAEFSEEANNFTITQVGEGKIVAQVSLEIVVSASADFSMYVWDSVDKEYFGAGISSAGIEHEVLAVEVLIAIGGDFGADQCELESVEIVSGAFYLDFGTVEIDYGEPEEP